MKQILKCALPLLALGFILTACDKEENISPEKLLPVKLELNGSGWTNHQSTYRIEYDATARIQQIHATLVLTVYGYGANSTRAIQDRIALIYNEAGLLIREDITREEKGKPTENTSNTFTYGDGIVQRNDDFTFYLDDSNRIIRSTHEYHGVNGEAYNDSEFYHYDSKGNLISWSENGEREWNHDRKNGIFRAVNMPQWYLMTQRHLGLSTGLYLINNMTESQTYRAKYTYNSFDYPDTYYSSTKPEIADGGSISAKIEYTTTNTLY